MAPSSPAGAISARTLAMVDGKEAAPRCLLCGSELVPVLEGVHDTRFGLPDVYAIHGCRRCGLEHTLPRPSQNELIRLYEDHYNFAEVTGRSYHGLRRLLHSPLFYRLWLALDGDISFHDRRGRGRLLDIGCNEGRGLAFYRANGFQAEGLELNGVAAASARAKGFSVYEEPLETFQPAESYDVIVMSNVLEHFLDIQQALGDVRRLLSDGGEVWISLPNNRSWLRRYFGRAWINWHVPFHIVHFSSKTLTRALQESGFEIRKVSHVTPAFWVAQTIIARFTARPGKVTRGLRDPKLVVPLILLARGLFFPWLWLNNRLSSGDCLVVVAQKR
jgi:SAM-dependent methyltransferase